MLNTTAAIREQHPGGLVAGSVLLETYEAEPVTQRQQRNDEDAQGGRNDQSNYRQP